MTRKDTIIAAALVNAGVLVILFVSALKSGDGVEKIVVEERPSESLTQEKVFVQEQQDVHDMLKRYAQESSISEPVTVSIPEALKEETQATSVAVPTKESSYTEVKVKNGDMLEKIARRHRTSVAEIMRMNHLSSTKLKIGQILKVPCRDAPLQDKNTSPKVPLEPTSAKYHTVQAGDNLWTIAVKNHVKVEDLLSLNDMTEEKAKRLKVGDTVRIR